MAVAAATAVIAPAAFLAAPAAYATDGNNGTTASESASETPQEENTPSTENETEPPAEESEQAEKAAEGDATVETGGESENDTSASEAQGEKKPEGEAEGEKKEDDKTSETPKTEGDDKPENESGTPDAESKWTPFECETFDLDENLQVSVSGLPSKIVAGSGWHNFTYSVTNDSDADLTDVYIETYTEYDDDTNLEHSLALELAQIEFKDPETGQWTDSYQELFEDEEGELLVTGSFVGYIDDLAKGETAEMDLRVRIDAKAPAGSSFALSSAIYAGEGTSCNGNGDSYAFTVLAKESKPGDVDEAKPSGEKPEGKKPNSPKPQGGAKELPVTGSLAETGSNSMLPTIGIAGGIAIVAGTGVVFALKRRGNGAAA
ncbi:hypothetical protein QCN29_11970 [Streptomyces sp. HNM0663]|uniref:LPXTG cell wall anchor domain-containing protein n=1 Tax=Streptomyces chengmaiensis TaxID=3040919 RepID=A0ABT6HLB9_9ACTN|nr:hypothetical protein [Streptomyces chengmaiensis]MDH2389498.1 hypothetical protein [Streptomyces chengmaiensis]